MNREDFARYVRDFDLKGLFIDLGWDNPRHPLAPIKIKEERFTFEPIAQKSGFLIILVRSASGTVPYYTVRSKIDNEIRKRSHEHMLIFLDKDKSMQVWLYSYQTNGKFRKTEITWNKYQDPERLYQRASGLFFGIDEQDKITIYDVRQRMLGSFATNSEKVTKKFYDGFKKQHTKFKNAMDGIADPTDKEWYASIMLNRLMFCYFMQKRGFLNNDRDYLKHKLTECREKFGQNKFFSFYRNFLLTLFHKGFAKPDHDPETIALIGRIPYLNGGLFDVHQLEQTYPDITIDDSAFESVFVLFDAYEWHLDSRECASGNEISPDVLGYIFEKYINDRAQMGAYYTQEDITEYIGRNSIIPFLFNKTKEKYADFFAPNRELWTMMRESGDKYIFDAVKKGSELPLPDYIAIGVDTSKPDLLERRSRWNEPADEAYALPTEIWRETVERRQRYEMIVKKINSGGIHEIQDFITYNLDICAFAQDAIETLDDPAFIRAMYASIAEITILDPTCGSGAFLFAALNLLEPLYDSCLSRMEDFLTNGQTLPLNAKKLFTETIEKKNVHPNKQYFIYKSIILNNLYGVDIMKEAVETAKLRLFLKLVSTAEPNYNAPNIGIEPLPDIDFNIKSGNTLVGFATEAEVQNTLCETVEGALIAQDVREKLKNLSLAMIRFKQCQLEQNSNHNDFLASKQDLNERQKQVNDILDKTLHRNGRDLAEWKKREQPFHWIAEFYRILDIEKGNGGFDVIIGNPPYVEYSKIKKIYKLDNYEVVSSGNLYAFVIERSLNLMHENSTIGMITQMSGYCTPRMKSYQNYLFKNTAYNYLSFFDDRPGKLFDIEDIRAAILVSRKKMNIKKYELYTTRYIKFKTECRNVVFDKIQYCKGIIPSLDGIIMKFDSEAGEKVAKKLLAKKNNLGFYITKTKNNNFIYYGRVFRNFIKILNFKSYFYSKDKDESSSNKYLYFNELYDVDIFSAIMNSTLFFWYYLNFSDGRDFTSYVTSFFPLPELSDGTKNQLKQLNNKMMEDLQKNSRIKKCYYKASGNVEYAEYYPKKSKAIIDEIDKVLADAYGFTEEELDYIINYDIKFRMGIGTYDDDNE